MLGIFKTLGTLLSEALRRLKASAQDKLVRAPLTPVLQVDRGYRAPRPTRGARRGEPSCWRQSADG